MRNDILRKGLVLGIIMLFIGASFLQQVQPTVKANLTDGLIAYWNFDEGSGTVAHDSSGYGNNGNLHGATWITGKYGSALEITSTSYVGDISSSYDDPITTALTFAAWVKWYGPTGGYPQSIIFDGRADSTTHYFDFVINHNSGTLWFELTRPGSPIASISSIPHDGTWTHIAAVFDDSSNTLSLFINGVQDNIITTNDLYHNSGVRPFIGNNHWAPSDGQWAPFNGIEDELRIYNRALTENEIKQLAGIINHPPDTPSNPNPSNHAIDVGRNTSLSWSSNDPDDDPLTYDVYFGTSSNPPLVINEYTTTSYNPGILDYTTKYYWKIVANDDTNGSTSGPVWDFTTVSQQNNPPSIPSNPSPSNHAFNIERYPSLTWICSDPDGDPLMYDIYFGTNSNPSLMNSNSSSTSYNPGILNYNTKYYWKIIAKDDINLSTSGPVWDFTTVSQQNNPPTVPSDPSPSHHAINVDINTTLSWTGGDPDVGDTVTYDVFFGSIPPFEKIASNISTLSFNPGTLANNLTYFWTVVAWDSHGLSTSGPEWYFTTLSTSNNPPNQPHQPYGSSSGKPGVSYTYQTSTTDPEGDFVYYMWDWDDGTPLTWAGPYNSGQNVTASHIWSAKGAYSMKVKTKDIYDKESPWSDPLPITMPYSHNPMQHFFDWLFQRFPNAFPLLRHMMGY